jgi:phosphoserine phosphatase
MQRQTRPFTAILSSDWSECLSPSGPFDFIAFTYPQLAPKLEEIFRGYTENRISLGEACARIEEIMPGPITAPLMDAYLDRAYAVYRGVPELIEWCRGEGVLFMINTTGMIAYFQRVFAKGLLPQIPVLSANPLFRFPAGAGDPHTVLDLLETQDKGKNTAAVAASMGIPAERVIVMGDSGGDGPHFEWAHRAGAFIISSMTKHSLAAYCDIKRVTIDRRFGLVYGKDEPRSVDKEMAIDFADLIGPIKEVLKARAARSHSV